MNPWILLAGVIALVSIGGGGYLKGRNDGRDQVIARQARDDQVRLDTLQAAQLGAAEAIAAIEVKNVTVRQLLETKLVEKPVYRDCVADERVLQLTNQAITGGAEPSGSSLLPGTGGDDGPHFR